MTAPTGEEFSKLWTVEVLQRNLETFTDSDSPSRLEGETIWTKVVEVGEARRFPWFGTSHQLWLPKELVTVLPFRFGLGKFACGATELGDLVIKLQYVRDENRHAPVRHRGRDLTNMWQIMPLEWLVPEEIYDLNRSFYHLSSEARAH